MLEQSPKGESAGTPSNSAGLPHPSVNSPSKDTLKRALIGSGVAVLLIVVASVIFMCQHRGVTTIGPWKTGLSGQLQKAFVTGDSDIFCTT